MNAQQIVNKLLEDFGNAKRTMRRLFVPGSQWERVNYRFPTKLSPDNIIPANTPITVTVVKAINDAIVFSMPDGQSSFLIYPDEQIVHANFANGGVDLIDPRGILLSYKPL